MNILQALTEAGEKVEKRDSEILMMYALGISREKLYCSYEVALSKDAEKCYKKLIRRREKKEPVAYITHMKEFMGLPFYVDKSVLIPRPDTEVLVEKAIQTIGSQSRTVLDLCTGSGCIGISIATYCPNAEVTASDISYKALRVAQKNAKTSNIHLVQSNLFSKLSKNHFDILVSNPPYIKKEVVKGLEKDVRDYEPHLALCGGKDGLEFYRKIIEGSKDYLKKEGIIFLEIDKDYAKEIQKMLLTNNYCDINIVKDLSGYDRVIIAKKENRCLVS